MYIQCPQMFTRKKLIRVDQAIKEYHRVKGTLPHSLSQLSILPDAPISKENDVIFDSWKHPFVYQVQNGSYILTSYGRDGKPGGIGLDCDLSNINPKPAAAELPFLQVIFDPLARGMVYTSIISGVFAFLLTFDVASPIVLSRQRWAELTFKLLGTLIATLIVAVFITMLHVPSGH